MSGVKWIKIYTDMVSNKKIKRIRSLPEGNNIILIWVFLIAQAGESNKNGALYLTDTIPFMVDDLAIEFEFDVSVIRLAIMTLQKFSMIEVFEEIIYIKNWEEYQNVDGLERIREQTRIRTSNYRQKLKQLSSCDVTCDATVTHSDAIELDKELDIELDKEKKIDIVPYREIIEYLNHEAGTKYKSSSRSTREHIHARWEDGFKLEDFRSVIDKKVASWTGTDQEKYLRPETLFGTKFEGYLNEKVSAKRLDKPHVTKAWERTPTPSVQDNITAQWLSMHEEAEKNGQA